jgi:hypothetical protein
MIWPDHYGRVPAYLLGIMSEFWFLLKRHCLTAAIEEAQSGFPYLQSHPTRREAAFSRGRGALV